MKNKTVQKTVMAALMAALCCIGTLIVQIPSPTGGFVNVGDCFVILSGMLLSPVYGALAAALGTGLADLLAGYAVYAPATVVIKGLMAIVTALIMRGGYNRHLKRIVSAVVAEAIMILGYFLWASVMFGEGLAALASIPPNLIQAVIGIVAAVAVAEIFDRTRLSEKFK